MLKHHEPSRTESTSEPKRFRADPSHSGMSGKGYADTGLRLIDTPRRSDPRPTSGPGRPWFAIAAGLLCWLVAGLLIIQL